MRVPFSSTKKWFLFGILWPFDRMDINPELTFVAIVRFCEVDYSSLGESCCWFPYDFDVGMLIIPKGVVPLKRVFLDES